MDKLNYLLSEYGATVTQASSILNMDILNYLLSEYGANCYPGSIDTKYG